MPFTDCTELVGALERGASLRVRLDRVAGPGPPHDRLGGPSRVGEAVRVDVVQRDLDVPVQRRVCYFAEGAGTFGCVPGDAGACGGTTGAGVGIGPPGCAPGTSLGVGGLSSNGAAGFFTAPVTPGGVVGFFVGKYTVTGLPAGLYSVRFESGAIVRMSEVVVQQTGPPRLLLVDPDLRRHDAAEERNLQRVEINVLTVRGPVPETANKFQYLRMDPVDPQVEGSLLACLLDRLLGGDDILEGEAASVPAHTCHLGKDPFRIAEVVKGGGRCDEVEAAIRKRQR